MQFEFLSDAAALEAEWWELWHRDPLATPFQSPAWLLPWRRHFPEGSNLALTWRRGGRLVGLLPLFLHEGRYLPWGAGSSDRLNGVFDPGMEVTDISNAIAALPLPLDLFQLPPGSILMSSPAPQGWNDLATASESCAVLTLPLQLGKKMMQNLRYYRRRAARAGATEPLRIGEPDVIGLARLHTRRWRSRSQPGIFADHRMLAWLGEALPALAERGLLRFYTIRVGASLAAALCVLCAKRHAFYYIGGFDPRYASLGLGTLAIARAIKEAQEQGDLSFDFLRGREPYKYHWGALDSPTYARRLVPPERTSAA